MESPAMQKDSSVLNFILGVILMLLLAFAAKAQDKRNIPNSANNQVIKKKKPVSAEEAKVLYEEKYGKQYPDKRKSYSRKDIEEIIPEETVFMRENKSVENLPVDKNNPTDQSITASSQNTKQPKAIYKGPQKNQPETIIVKPTASKNTEPVFLEHIEMNINSGNN
ncbi:MAG: hypothetical protein ACM3H8_05675 [Sphingobacteriales bacterium]